MSKEFIKIGGAREHNLKNLSLQIPRDKLVVVTGSSPPCIIASTNGDALVHGNQRAAAAKFCQLILLP